MAIKHKSGRIRLIVQILFFALVTLIAVSHSLEEKGIHIPFFPSASLHAVCPFGGVVSIYEFIRQLCEKDPRIIFYTHVYCDWIGSYYGTGFLRLGLSYGEPPGMDR